VSIPVIDIHPHVISTDVVRYPRAPLGGHQSAWSQERPVSVEQLIVEQDRAGISKAALVQASTCYGHDNSCVADAVNAYTGAGWTIRGRFRPGARQRRAGFPFVSR
jgi:L-fuconolactonase